MKGYLAKWRSSSRLALGGWLPTSNWTRCPCSPRDGCQAALCQAKAALGAEATWSSRGGRLHLPLLLPVKGVAGRPSALPGDLCTPTGGALAAAEGVALWQRPKGVALQLAPKAGLWLHLGQALLRLALHRGALAEGTSQVGRDATKGGPQVGSLRRLKATWAWCLHEQAKRA